MDATHRQIVDYWSCHEDECDLSVDWAEAEKLCWRCAQGRLLQRCNIVPRALGGTEEPSNLVLLCGQCHAEAPNVAEPEFMWMWLRAHAASVYGTYWYNRGLNEYKFLFGTEPFVDVNHAALLLPELRIAIERYVRQTSTHWGQGKLNPATIAWLLRQVVREARHEAEPIVR
jgi:HNH endonuclease